jgi:hypothetical protein
MFDFFNEDPRQDVINQILVLELENLFDYSPKREQEIKRLREEIDFYDPVLPE